MASNDLGGRFRPYLQFWPWIVVNKNHGFGFGFTETQKFRFLPKPKLNRNQNRNSNFLLLPGYFVTSAVTQNGLLSK